MAAKSGENWNFSHLHRILLYYPVGQEFARNRSHMVFEIFTLFHFPQKSKMAAKSGRNWNFSPLHRIVLYYAVGQKFAWNRCLVRFEILTLCHFPLKSKMAAKSGENWNFFPWHRILLYYPAGKNFAQNRSISCKWFSRYSLLHFPPKVSKIEIFPLGTGYSCTTLRVKNSLEIALSLTVFEIFTLFHFPQKSKMAAKSGENWKFSPWHRKLLYYPACQKFAWNRSIYVTVFKIFTHFHFPLNSKMAAKSGENWNFSPMHRTLL